MRYDIKNTLYGLAVLAAASMLPNMVKAQTDVSLFDDDDDINISLDDKSVSSDDVSLDVDVSLPKDDGLISPKASVNKTVAIEEEVEPAPVQEDVEEVIPVEITEENAGSFIDSEDAPDTDNLAPSTNSESEQTEPQTEIINAPEQSESVVPSLSENIDNELFSRMSDLERQTTLLNLELKKERVANEVAAVKAQRQKALREERERMEAEERKKIEWQNEQDRLMVEEQRKLKEAEMAMEKLRQEKIVKAYKESMLASTQKWIQKNAEMYNEMAKKDEQMDSLMEEYSGRIETLLQKIGETRSNAEAARINYDKKVANLESQIAILKTRLESEIEKAGQLANGNASILRKNPFAEDISGPVSPEKVRLSKEYAIMEITGHADDLTAKLINEDGDIFDVKVGTTLRNGYTIDEITKTFIGAVKDDDKDYLYFSAGGILDREPVKSEIVPNTGSVPSQRSGGSSRGPVSTSGIPSLNRGMMIK